MKGERTYQRIPWPDGKRFAFTVCDDTDLATLENIGPVYSFLSDCGFRTTKSCWSIQGDPCRGTYMGQTCDDRDYLQWLLDLQCRGFEIAWHGPTWHGTPREGTRSALDKFAQLFGHYPYTATNHTRVENAIYWGDHRLTGWRVYVYNLMTCFRRHGKYRGNVEGDEYFWGDLCRERIKYYRDFVFRGVNTLRACPFMPYRDPSRPYVNNWFASSNGRNIRCFNNCLSEARQDQLEMEGGACIMYTHFASGFTRGKDIDSRFAMLMKRLAAKNGWFVPVRELLDHIQKVRGPREITRAERAWIERRWLWEKAFLGTQ